MTPNGERIIVLSTVSRLFYRYCDHHYTVYGAGFQIIGADGRKLGQVERLCYGRTGLRAEGWCIGDSIALGVPGQMHWQRPDISRSDVTAALGLSQHRRTGFNVAWFGDVHGAVFSVKKARSTLQIALPEIARHKRMWAGMHIRFGFGRDLLRATPALLRALFRPNAVNRGRAKQALRLGVSQHEHMIDRRYFQARSLRVSRQTISLIMPVYNAFEITQQALSRIADHTDVPWRMILVEDCSSDARVRPMVRKWAGRMCALGHDVQLLENKENLGFIGSVNRALNKAQKHGDHVVLLNSDALVPKGWASRLMHPILLDPKVASVTPLSNDAEIMTAPVICRRHDLRPGFADRLDAELAAKISPDAYQCVPTGVGFCMALSARYLKKFPQFDTAFGKGYGEEVDWCQRVRHAGGRHVCQPALFVEHRGGASFGSAAKQAAIARNNQRVSQRYPNYDHDVQHFIATDPLRTARLFTACANLASDQDRVPVFIAHSLGGGAELYLIARLGELAEQGKGAVVLRVGGRHRWRVELHGPQGTEHANTDDFAVLHALLSPLRKREIIYSCAVGDPDASGIPDSLIALTRGCDATLTTLVHDYFMISPSYCLLGADGTFNGVPERQSLDTAHRFIHAAGQVTKLEEWRKSWGQMITRSTRIECFSASSARLFAQAYQDASDRLCITPHIVAPVGKVPPAVTGSATTIGVLGDIGLQKGAQVVCDLAHLLPVNDIQRIAVIGRIDPQFVPPAKCIETGSYQRADIVTLASRHNLGCWIIPSIWPETFSYTTHEALATGLPVFCFDLGAQGEAASKADNGHVMPLSWQRDPAKILKFIQEVLAHDTACRRVDHNAPRRGNRGFAA